MLVCYVSVKYSFVHEYETYRILKCLNTQCKTETQQAITVSVDQIKFTNYVFQVTDLLKSRILLIYMTEGYSVCLHVIQCICVEGA